MSAPTLSLLAWDGRLGIDAGQEPRAGDYYDAMQDRHVPVTPRLAEGLARLEGSRDPSSVPPWGRAYTLAGQALGLGGTFGRTEFWATLTPVFVIELAEPLLRKAALACGEVAITTPGAERTAVAYDAACQRIEAALERFLSNPDAAGLGFWSRAGMAMLAAYQERTAAAAGLEARQPGAPQRVMPQLPGLVFELEPERPAQDPQERRKIRPSARSERVRSGIRPREGGVDGIATARGFEELDAALMTTFAYPDELLILKLMEEGYQVTSRPPFRNPVRDLLSVTLGNASGCRGPSALVKAAWIDAAARLGFILARMGRSKSELGWCDLLDEGPICAASSAQAQSDRGRLDGWSLAGELRRGVVARSSLTPAAFVERPSRPWSDSPADRRPREAVKALLIECGRVAHGLGSLKEATRRRQAGTHPARTDDYSVVLTIDIAPAQSGQGQRVTDWHSDRAAIARKIDLRSPEALRAGQILVPPLLSAEAVFRVASDVDKSERLVQAEPELSDTEALQSLLGQLSDWFVEQAVRALDG